MRKHKRVTLWNVSANDWQRYKVVDRYFPEPPYEPIVHGNWLMERVDIQPMDPGRIRTVMDGRDCGVGPTAVLRRDGHPWMSDTMAEVLDHMEVIDQIAWPFVKRVLINGLGLGVVLNAALSFDHVEHIDVVEIDREVIDFVGSRFTDPRVTIHQGDAFTIKFPRGTRWDVVWHDIWPDISEKNLPEIKRLKNRYGHRCGWQGAWVEDACRWMRWVQADDERWANYEWERLGNLIGRDNAQALRSMTSQQLLDGSETLIAVATMPEEATT